MAQGWPRRIRRPQVRKEVPKESWPPVQSPTPAPAKARLVTCWAMAKVCPAITPSRRAWTGKKRVVPGGCRDARQRRQGPLALCGRRREQRQHWRGCGGSSQRETAVAALEVDVISRKERELWAGGSFIKC